jgi:hypothetical protein
VGHRRTFLSVRNHTPAEDRGGKTMRRNIHLHIIDFDTGDHLVFRELSADEKNDIYEEFDEMTG